MKHSPSILACGAALAVFLLAATGFAQVGQVPVIDQNGFGDAVAKRAPRAAALRVQRRSLANQLRPYVRYELMHLRAACGLTREQLREIRPEADAVYEDVIDRIAEDTQRSRAARKAEECDYLEAIHAALLRVFHHHLTLPQRAAYEEDLRLRLASRKEAGVDQLVAVLDRELLLTGRQRQQLVTSLSAEWDDHWCDAIEVAFSQQTCCPRFPETLVTSYLSAAQQEAWRHIRRFQGRLWGVAIDHGGDPAMERELGADARAKRPAGRRPIVPIRLASAPAAAGQAQPAPGRPPAAVLRPASPSDDDDASDERAGPEAPGQQEERLRPQEAAFYLGKYFDRVAFGPGLTEATARMNYESALEKRVDYLERACGLDRAQKRKLLAAGQGDLKRFFDHVSEMRSNLRDIDNARAMVVAIHNRESETLATERNALLAPGGPIFTRTVPRTLNDDQRALLNKDDRDRRAFRYRADVRWTAVLLARSLGLVDDQRRRLESVLLKETRPPLKFGMFDHTIVMYQASRIPEARIRPIFDNLQWRVMTQELAAVRRWELNLKHGGFLPDEAFGDPDEAALPPIHLLDPPAIRSP